MAGGNPRPPALDCASRSPGTQFLLKSYDAEGMGVVKGGDERGGEGGEGLLEEVWGGGDGGGIRK